ncbi:MAG: hypothetical protein IJR89_04340 [Clostridia bacterium]|nr:hypothetical protein [Clostridia bacterium]
MRASKLAVLLLAAALVAALVAVSVHADTDTVYLDGTGATAGAYTDITSAFNALPASGGTVVVTGDTTVGTKSAGVTLPTKSGKVTIRGEGNVTLNIARSLTLGGELQIRDIHLHSASGNTNGNLIAKGKKFTLGPGLTTSNASGASVFAIFGGAASGTVTYHTDVTVLGGTYRAIYAGSYNGTLNGTSSLTLSNAVCTGTVSAGNFQGTCNATKSITVDLRGGATVSAGTWKETPDTILVDDGYEYVLSGGVYSQNSLTPATSDVVYLDPAGTSSHTEDVYSGFAAALNALPASGGTIVVCSDATITDGSANTYYVLAPKPLHITGETADVRLTQTQSILFGEDVTIDNITWAENAGDGYSHIYAQGHHLTFGENVTCLLLKGVRYPALFVGSRAFSGAVGAITNGDGTVTVQSGTFWAIFAGGLNSASSYSGTATIAFEGGTVTEKITLSGSSAAVSGTVNVTVSGGQVAKVEAGATFIGTNTVTVTGGRINALTNVNSVIDLTGGKTVTVGAALSAGSLVGGGTLIMESGSSLTVDAFTGNAAVQIPVPEGDKTYLTINDPSTAGTVSYTPVGTETLTRTEEDGKVKYTVTSAAPAPTVVYLDPAGTSAHTENVFTTLADAAAALSSNGGTIVVCSDAEMNADSGTPYHFPAKAIRITGETGTEKLTQRRDTYLNGDFVIDNITWVNSVSDSHSFLFAQGHDLTVGENVVCVPNGSAYLCLLAGSRNGVAGAVGSISGADATVTVKSGSFRAIFGGGLGVSYQGNVSILFEGGYVVQNISLAGSGAAGTVNGTGSVTFCGGKVDGNIQKNTAAGVFTGTSVITLKGGELGGVADLTPAIDLSEGGALTLNGSAAVSGLTGGGKLTLGGSAAVTTPSFTGSVELKIKNPSNDFAYLTVTDENTVGTVTYVPAIGGDTLTRTVSDGQVRYTVNVPTVTVKITYYNPEGENAKQPTLRLERGYSSASTVLNDYTTGKDGWKNYIVAELTPGLYDCILYVNNSANYARKYFYISGQETGTVEYDLPLYPYAANNHEEPRFSRPTDEITENFWNFAKTNVPDFTLVTPVFTMEKYTQDIKRFMNNEDLCAFVDSLSSPYLHVYYPFALTPLGNRCPVLVFTKDQTKTGITLPDLAEQIASGGIREILMIVGGQHGNEPSGTDGSLQLAYDLCGAYGEEVLDHFGAIVMIPCVSCDNNQRFAREYPDGLNSNRDLVYLSKEGSQNIAYIYKLFMPTVFVSAHEDNENNTVDPSDNSIADMRSMSVESATVPNSPLTSVKGLVDGTETLLTLGQAQMMNRLIQTAQDQGFRAMHYYDPSSYPVAEKNYAAVRGSYSFLIEIQRMWTGKNNYDFSVKEMVTAMKNLVAEIISVDETEPKTIAQTVYEGRENAKVAAFSADRLFALGTSSGVAGTDPAPSVYVDGTYKDASATKNWKFPMTVTGTRVLPLSYVIPADLDHIDEILHLLEMHGISYVKLENGATRTLKQYSTVDTSGDLSKLDVTIGAAAEVTFTSGAYEISLNSSDAYLIAYLFEPDSYQASFQYVSLVKMGYLALSDPLYRNESETPAGLPALSFSGASLTLENDLTFNFKANAALFTEYGYADPCVVFSFNGEETTVTEYRVENGKYVFSFTGIAPHQMNDVLTAALHASLYGKNVSCVMEYSVGEYCYDAYVQYGDAQYATLHRLLADLLQYGARAQEYMSYRTDAPVTDRLAVYPELAACATAGTPTYTTVRDLAVEIVASPAAVFKGAGLNLQNTVAIRLKIQTNEDPATLTLKAEKEGGGEYEVPGTAFLSAGTGLYYAFFTDFHAGEMKKTVYFTVYQGENAVSNKVAYSIESYAYDKQGDAGLTDLLAAMMNYGESARLYRAEQ